MRLGDWSLQGLNAPQGKCGASNYLSYLRGAVRGASGNDFIVATTAASVPVPWSRSGCAVRDGRLAADSLPMLPAIG